MHLGERTDGHEKSDASREQAAQDDDVGIGEVGAIEASSIAAGCMPAWCGALVFGLTSLILIGHRRLRRSSE